MRYEGRFVDQCRLGSRVEFGVKAWIELQNHLTIFLKCEIDSASSQTLQYTVILDTRINTLVPTL